MCLGNMKTWSYSVLYYLFVNTQPTTTHPTKIGYKFPGMFCVVYFFFALKMVYIFVYERYYDYGVGRGMLSCRTYGGGLRHVLTEVAKIELRNDHEMCSNLKEALEDIMQGHIVSSRFEDSVFYYHLSESLDDCLKDTPENIKFLKENSVPIKAYTDEKIEEVVDEILSSKVKSARSVQ